MQFGAPIESLTSYRLQIPGQYLENGNHLPKHNVHMQFGAPFESWTSYPPAKSGTIP